MWFAIHEASSGPPSGSWPWLGGVRVLAGGRAAGGGLGLQAVEDGLEAELEGVVGCRAGAGGGGWLAGGVEPGVGGGGGCAGGPAWCSRWFWPCCRVSALRLSRHRG